jgi:hypothetical protein
MSQPNLRKAERPAYCRGCDKVIEKGDEMISFHSYRNRGQFIHICVDCSGRIGALAWVAKEKSHD